MYRVVYIQHTLRPGEVLEVQRTALGEEFVRVVDCRPALVGYVFSLMWHWGLH